jgi:hypothetical protein
MCDVVRQDASSRLGRRRVAVVETIAVVAALVICGTADRVAWEAWASAEGAGSAATASMTSTLRLSDATSRRLLRLANEAIARMRAAHDRRIVDAAPVLEILRHNVIAALRGISSTSGEPRDPRKRIRALQAACQGVAPSISTPTKDAGGCPPWLSTRIANRSTIGDCSN